MIPHRHTNRLPFTEQPVPDKLLCLLQLMARGEGAWLCLVGDENARDLMADLVETGDLIRWADKLSRYELAAWMRPRGHLSSDGVPGYALDPDDLLGYADRSVIRTVNLGADQVVKDRRLVINAPVLAVLGTDADSPAAWLAAGQALGRVVLCACALGVCTSFLSQPTASPVLRVRLHETMRRVLSKAVFPQLLLRLGYGPEVKPTPRRSVEEVTI
ncbi:MAG TPA: hypothetical protein VNA16_04035 [Abditibacteriaceae bacterium]|nr:hypothetical protein [Abditibacteriaceae bacterium]